MKHINELALILNNHLNWHKSRATCLAQIVRGMIAVKTVNLAQIAVSFTSKAKITSSYRRIQRFFQTSFSTEGIAQLALGLFAVDKSFSLIMDRTNWKWGKTHLNLLVLSIVYQGISIPVYWLNLAKAGTSNADERMYAVIKCIYRFGKHRISGVLADREFIGQRWFTWLQSCNIPFTIRIKGKMLVGRTGNDSYPIPARSLFSHLGRKRCNYLREQFYLGDVPVYLAASNAPNGNLLIVASLYYDKHALKKYKRRWEIETMFGCWKSQGFNLEDTHMVDHRKLERLVAVMVIAFCWSYAIGIRRQRSEKIPIKAHGRKAQSIFRFGYDLLRQAVLLGPDDFRVYFCFLLPASFGGTRV